eukprot:2216608-Pyramimonas_sp.AAC.2
MCLASVLGWQLQALDPRGRCCVRPLAPESIRPPSLPTTRVANRLTYYRAQAEAINLLAGQKTNENPENVVGVLSLAGKGPRVLVTPTGDLGKILGAMHGLGMEGETNICSGVQLTTFFSVARPHEVLGRQAYPPSGHCRLPRRTGSLLYSNVHSISTRYVSIACIYRASGKEHMLSVAQLALKHRQNKNQRQRIVLFTGSPIAADQVGSVVKDASSTLTKGIATQNKIKTHGYETEL